jgi:hypothetical protein
MNFLNRETTYMGNVNINFTFWDPLLYFDPMQLFHNISIIKITNVHYQDNVAIQLLQR